VVRARFSAPGRCRPWRVALRTRANARLGEVLPANLRNPVDDNAHVGIDRRAGIRIGVVAIVSAGKARAGLLTRVRVNLGPVDGVMELSGNP